MKIQACVSKLRYRPWQAGAVLGLLPLLVASPVQAAEFSFVDNQVSGSLDTTLSYGSMWRVQGRDKNNITDINADDGNRNFDTGLVSEVYKATSDLSAKYQNYGLFVRGTAYYDTQIMDKRNDYYDTTGGVERPSQSFPQDDRFTEDTRHNAGRTAELLDAYLYGNWDIYEQPLSAKVGRQVFNWGEGVFYRGGVNTTNPVDAAKFHLPGSELKEVLVPVEAFSFNLGLTDNLSVEAFYQWKWEETRLDPVGTYFAETDLFAEGGNTAYTTEPALAELLAAYPVAAAFGLVGNGPFGPNAYLNPTTGTFKVANVGPDIEARDDGQFGLALRYIAEELNSTEFGAYFVNYHGKEPQIAVDLRGYQGVDLATLGAVAALLGAPGAEFGLATLDMAGNAQARRDYVEDIRMYGFSFNTTLGDASVSGEIAYRPNAPISIAATDDILGDLLIQGVTGLGSALYDDSVAADQACAPLAGKQLCRGSLFENYERAETYNISLSTIYNFGPLLSFDSVFGVAELASQHIRGSSLRYSAFDGSVRKFASSTDKAYVDPENGDSDQISRDSYGYTLLLSGSWNDVYAGVKLSPYVVFQDDFKGNSDRTGNFIEGRKAHTLGVDASYLNSFEVGMQYTEYYGAGRNNGLRDRDNLSLSAKYSF